MLSVPASAALTATFSFSGWGMAALVTAESAKRAASSTASTSESAMASASSSWYPASAAMPDLGSGNSMSRLGGTWASSSRCRYSTPRARNT